MDNIVLEIVLEIHNNEIFYFLFYLIFYFSKNVARGKYL